MAKLHPFSDQLPPAREWHVIGLLPVGELVLLDGDDKVGKTLFTATLGAILSRQPDLQTPGSIIYANTLEQNEILAEQLALHQPKLEFIRQLNLHDLPSEGNALENLPGFLEEHIQASNTKLLILDGLHDFLLSRLDASQKGLALIPCEVLWRSLRDLSHLYQCTIVVTRTEGMHQNRSYGPFTRAGTRVARVILTLMYHPVDPAKRLLTVARHQRGLIGGQFSLNILPRGLAYFVPVEKQDVLKPARFPAPWRPDPELSDPDQEIFEEIERVIGVTTIRAEALEELVTKSYSKSHYGRALARLKLPFSYKGDQCFFMPTEPMLFRQLQKKGQLAEIVESMKTAENQANAARTDEDDQPKDVPPVKGKQPVPPAKAG